MKTQDVAATLRSAWLHTFHDGASRLEHVPRDAGAAARDPTASLDKPALS